MSKWTRDATAARGCPSLTFDDHDKNFFSDWNVRGDTVEISVSIDGTGTTIRLPVEDFMPILEFLNKHLYAVDPNPQSSVTQNDVNQHIVKWGKSVAAVLDALTSRVKEMEGLIELLEVRIAHLEDTPAEPAKSVGYPAWSNNVRQYAVGEKVTMDGIDYVCVMPCQPSDGEEWSHHNISCWKALP
jgi:hypothetical protein